MMSTRRKVSSLAMLLLLTSPAYAELSLPLECESVPRSSDQLCVIRTESPYGPYDQVAYYHLDKNQRAYLLGSENGGVGTFAGFGFSDSGEYVWLGWAEEGHPHFLFYRTRQFIDNGINTEGLAVIGDYEFQEFLTFSDTGLVRYAIDEESCRYKQKGAHYWVKPEGKERYCVKTLQLPENIPSRHR